MIWWKRSRHSDREQRPHSNSRLWILTMRTLWQVIQRKKLLWMKRASRTKPFHKSRKSLWISTKMKKIKITLMTPRTLMETSKLTFLQSLSLSNPQLNHKTRASWTSSLCRELNKIRRNRPKSRPRCLLNRSKRIRRETVRMRRGRASWFLLINLVAKLWVCLLWRSLRKTTLRRQLKSYKPLSLQMPP